jgi:hypothetical protein
MFPTTHVVQFRTAFGTNRVAARAQRHHAITELAESQASDRTIMSIAGHVSQRILAHYSHVRIEAKRKALDPLATGAGKWSEPQKRGYDTNNDTKSPRRPFFRPSG